jgi:hypothetical protein
MPCSDVAIDTECMTRWCELTGVSSQERSAASDSYRVPTGQERGWNGNTTRGPTIPTIASGRVGGYDAGFGGASDLQYIDQSASQSDLDLMRMYVLDESLGVGAERR